MMDRVGGVVIGRVAKCATHAAIRQYHRGACLFWSIRMTPDRNTNSNQSVAFQLYCLVCTETATIFQGAVKQAPPSISSLRVEGKMIPNDLSIAALCKCAVAFLVVWYFVSSLAAWSRLRHIPGPGLHHSPISWELDTILGQKTFDRFLNLRDYGPLVRITPGYVVTDDPDVLRKTMALRGKYTRDTWYAAAKFTPGSDSMATQLNTAAHDALKAKTIGSYSGREFGTDLEGAIDSQVVRLVDLVRRKFISTRDDIRPVDFAHLSRYFSLDVISSCSFSKAWEPPG